jgi:hypothetical protein
MWITFIKEEYETLEALKVGDTVPVRIPSLTGKSQTVEGKIVQIRKAHVEPDHRILRLPDRKDEDAYYILYEVFIEAAGQVKQCDYMVPGPNSREAYQRYLDQWK